MTQQHLDFGTAADNDGEGLKTAFQKVEDNFTELYARTVGPQVSRNDPAHYQTILATGTASNIGIAAASTIYAYPVHVARAMSITKIGANVSAAGASTNVRVGLYKDANGQPGALVADSGTLSMASTGAKEAAVSLTLQPGLYWLCVVFDATTGGLSGFAVAGIIPLLGRNGSLAQITNLQRAMTFGAFPSDESGQTYTAGALTGAYGPWIR